MAKTIDDDGHCLVATKPFRPGRRIYQPDKLPDPVQCAGCLIEVNDRHDASRLRLAMSDGSSWRFVAFADEAQVAAPSRAVALAPQVESLMDRDGKPVMEGGRPVSLGMIAVMALDAPVPQSPNVLTEKLSRYKLQMRIHGATGPVDITVEEAAMIKKCLAEIPHFTPLVVGRVVDELENPSEDASVVAGSVVPIR